MMGRNALRAVVLVDEETFRPNDPNFTKYKPNDNCETEFYVTAALRRLGFSVTVVPATADLGLMLQLTKASKPDLVFNLVEHVGGDRANDSVVASLLEIEGLAFTGASARALALSRDKYLSKVIVASSGVTVPKSMAVNARTAPLFSWDIFPAIIKPMDHDGSEGIEERSYATNLRDLHAQAQRLTKRISSLLICEEYIDGREFILTLSGTKNISVDSIRELVFPPEAVSRFATQRVKFDQKYKRQQGIHYADPSRKDGRLIASLQDAAQKAYRALEINSYAKLEFRVRADEPVFIEGNPNSILSPFAKTTDFAAIGYDKFIRKIVRLALSRSVR